MFQVLNTFSDLGRYPNAALIYWSVSKFPSCKEPAEVDLHCRPLPSRSKSTLLLNTTRSHVVDRTWNRSLCEQIVDYGRDDRFGRSLACAEAEGRCASMTTMERLVVSYVFPSRDPRTVPEITSAPAIALVTSEVMVVSVVGARCAGNSRPCHISLRGFASR